MRKVSEVLVSSLARFGPNGEHWIQGELFKGQNIKTAREFCSIGAINQDIVLNNEQGI